MKSPESLSNFAISVVLLLLSFAYSNSFAAEFSTDDVAPYVEVFVLTEDLVALQVSPGYRIPKWEQYPRFFAATRPDYRFERISEDAFSRITSIERYEKRFDRTTGKRGGQIELPSWRETTENLCSEYDYESDARTMKTFDSADSHVSVEVSCRTYVSRAISVEDKVWMGTLRFGEFGDYSAEGLLVFALDGTRLNSIDIRGPIEDVLVDPWGTDVFTLSRYGVTVVSQNYEVFAERFPEHQFDHANARPDVVMPSDSSGLNALAVIAYDFGPALYERFYRLIGDETYPSGDELLYQYNMSPPGTRYAYPEVLPEKLDPILEYAEPTARWRHFACFLSSEQAEKLCTEWHESGR